MAQPKRWLDEVIDALQELGGEGSLQDIYKMIRRRNIMDFCANRNWEARIRGTIETHSSDSDAFNGYADIFESVYGIGQGQWKLRS